MNAKLDAKLCKKYPLLYADRMVSMQTTAMCWGFQCGDGWYKLIDELSAKLETMIAAWIKTFPNNIVYVPRASTVKEKYGTLRFYMTIATDEMYTIIDKVESKSAKTCEACGKPGKIRGQGWYYTRCYKCWKKQGSGLCL